MGTQAVQLEARRQIPQVRQWRFATRVAFRFCFVYLVLYCLGTQIVSDLIPFPNTNIPYLGGLWPMRQIVLWTAAHVFRVSMPLVYKDDGSGDKIFDWVLVFCQLVIAILATAVWSVLDRRRENYSTLHKWFRLFLRFCLASQLIHYGVIKIIPLQMPATPLVRLLEPYGNFSPMGVLWSFIGAAPAYETFVGCAEALGGVLFIVPRTTTLGALVSLADMSDVFALNMSYDVAVKLLSFHLVLLSLFLLAPDVERLVSLFILNRGAGPSTQPPLFAKARANRIALAAQVAFGVLFFGVAVYGGWRSWNRPPFGAGSPKSRLYGIWDVNELTIDGQTRSPLITDYDRWRRVIFQFPTRMAFQRMDNSLVRYGAKIDDDTLAMTKDDDKNWKASFRYQHPVREQLILDGEMDGHKVHMQLQLVDEKKFLLLSRGFHWIQENPFNR